MTVTNTSKKNQKQQLERLNRDTTKTTKNIYKVIQQKGNIDLTIDPRMFTKDVQKEIKEDVDRSKLLGSSITDVVTKESVGLATNSKKGQTSLLDNIRNRQDFYTAAKTFYNSPGNKKHKDILANPSKYTPDDRQLAEQAMVGAISDTLGIKPAKVLQILSDENKGYYSYETENIYVSDNANKNSKDLAKTTSHEVSHAWDAKEYGVENKSEEYKGNREEYANTVSGDFSDNLSKSYASDNYDLSQSTWVNANTSLTSSTNPPTEKKLKK